MLSNLEYNGKQRYKTLSYNRHAYHNFVCCYFTVLEMHVPPPPCEKKEGTEKQTTNKFVIYAMCIQTNL